MLTYEVRCKTCGDDPNEKEALYYGTSGFTLHKRLKEHEADIRTNQQSNAMAKHRRTKHNGQNVEFEAQPVRGGMAYNVDRFLHEAVMIDQSNRRPDINSMNQRGEWGFRGLNRLTVTNSILIQGMCRHLYTHTSTQ